MRAKSPTQLHSPQQKGTSLKSNFDLYVIPDPDLFCFFQRLQGLIFPLLLAAKLGSKYSVIANTVV